MCGQVVCVDKVCVSKLCGDKLCGDKRQAAERRGEARRGGVERRKCTIKNKNPTQRCGEKALFKQNQPSSKTKHIQALCGQTMSRNRV